MDHDGVKMKQFKVLQRNADHYAQNSKNSERMQAAIEKAGYFREPIDNGGRSFKPQYGPAQEVEMVNSDYVHAKGYIKALEKGKGEEHSTLLKQAIPATKGTVSGEVDAGHRRSSEADS